MGSAASIAPLNSRLVSTMAGHRPALGTRFCTSGRCLRKWSSCSFVIGVLPIVFDCCRELPSIGPQELHRPNPSSAPREQGQLVSMTATLPERDAASVSIYRRTSGSTFASYVAVGSSVPAHADRSLIMADIISGINIPDSKIAREAAELVRQYETEMLLGRACQPMSGPVE